MRRQNMSSIILTYWPASRTPRHPATFQPCRAHSRNQTVLPARTFSRCCDAARRLSRSWRTSSVLPITPCAFTSGRSSETGSFTRWGFVEREPSVNRPLCMVCRRKPTPTSLEPTSRCSRPSSSTSADDWVPGSWPSCSETLGASSHPPLNRMPRTSSNASALPRPCSTHWVVTPLWNGREQLDPTIPAPGCCEASPAR